jgi:hypothetical protein
LSAKAMPAQAASAQVVPARTASAQEWANVPVPVSAGWAVPATVSGYHGSLQQFAAGGANT